MGATCYASIVKIEALKELDTKIVSKDFSEEDLYRYFVEVLPSKDLKSLRKKIEDSSLAKTIFNSYRFLKGSFALKKDIQKHVRSSNLSKDEKGNLWLAYYQFLDEKLKNESLPTHLKNHFENEVEQLKTVKEEFFIV